MSLLTLQQDVAILFYATLGKKADDKALTYFAKKLESGAYTQSELASKFILSQDGQHRYDGLTTSQKVQYIYQNTNGTLPDAATLSALTAQVDAGKTLGSLTTTLISETKNYAGSEALPQSQQQHLENVINTTLYPSQVEQPAQIDAAADIQGIYYLLGSMTNSTAINYWSGILDSGKKTAADIANYFAASKNYISSLNNEDFVKKIFSEAFGTAASNSDVQNYVTGLNNQSETRGDVIMRMMADIRNDTSHEAAKQNFLAATHVYAPGELPAAQFTETVMSLYLTVAGVAADATALDTYSRLLASGTTNDQLLKILSGAYQFRNAGDYQNIYLKLYGSALDSNSAQAILLKAGNDKIKASSLIIDAFRDGKYPLDNNPAPPPTNQLHNFDVKLGEALGYQKVFNGAFSLSDSGKLMADINARASHEVTSTELASLTSFSQLNINANVNIAVDLSLVPLKDIHKIVLSGDYATSATVRDSLGNKIVELLLNDANIANANAALPLKATAATLEADAVLSNAKINLLLDSALRWAGNGVNGGANHIGSEFFAQKNIQSDNYTGSLSANFITKSVYLTTNDSGGIDGSIVSNLNQFLYFTTIDLTHYRGTGEIYLNGQLVANEGSNVFDFGLFSQNASIYNAAYNNVSSLQQAQLPTTSSNGKFTGQGSALISDYSGDLTLLNYSNAKFTIGGELTKDSNIHIYDTAQSDTSFLLDFTQTASQIHYLNMGTFSLTSDHKNLLEIYMASNINTVQNRTLTLSGGDNSIEVLMLNGLMYSGDRAVALNLTIAADFSDNLKTIIGSDYTDRRYYSDMKLLLVAEKGGTGGGSFYNTLNTLTNKNDFSHIIDTLAGDQLKVDDTGLTVYTANVKGNTTVDTTRELTFTDSTIDSMVTLNAGYQNSVITAGDVGNQWIFSKTGDKTATLYGSATTATELKNAFTGLTATDNAQDLFSQVLANITNGTSTNNLSEVGLLKLDKSVYVIVDNNHNQTFDADDLVFSIGNQDPYVAAVSLHYQAPAITVNGAAATTHLVEEMA
ncbi:DUF4214 domain-containing protein [Serratia proteamaculans]|uniref:DUF4214 domain-containing protein n=1 Tax=Serratia proteamaculans TaxID=28151 RepID=A0A5Q2VEE5_SERPR|nr:DUF4214 domain-containing protein [Serratia proteamaculans]QGH63972.1 DUF4214 domain-containing protein [Serratia proteamaculans]